MLPFLKPDKMASVVMAARKPDGSLEPKGEEGEMDHGKLSAAEDLIRAIHAKDAKAVAEAMQASYDMCESKEDGSDELMDENE